MVTNFPSKIPEFAQYGKPLITWGPREASGVKWARDSGQGLIVDKEGPHCLVKALEALANDKSKQARLAKAAQEAALEYFNPKAIQSEFMKSLRSIVC